MQIQNIFGYKNLFPKLSVKDFKESTPFCNCRRKKRDKELDTRFNNPDFTKWKKFK